jgi:hypothetical protein
MTSPFFDEFQHAALRRTGEGDLRALDIDDAPVDRPDFVEFHLLFPLMLR